MSLRVAAIPVTLNGIQPPLARAGTDKMARLVAKVTQPLVEISPSCRTSGSRGSIGAERKIGTSLSHHRLYLLRGLLLLRYQLQHLLLQLLLSLQYLCQHCLGCRSTKNRNLGPWCIIRCGWCLLDTGRTYSHATTMFFVLPK